MLCLHMGFNRRHRNTVTALAFLARFFLVFSALLQFCCLPFCCDAFLCVFFYLFAVIPLHGTYIFVCIHFYAILRSFLSWCSSALLVFSHSCLFLCILQMHPHTYTHVQLRKLLFVVFVCCFFFLVRSAFLLSAFQTLVIYLYFIIISRRRISYEMDDNMSSSGLA